MNTSSIEILLNATIGIDVEHYLSRIYTYKKEQFLFGLGGVPSSLNSYIQSDLHVFKEFNIRPIFVLPGLRINSHQKSFTTNELSPQEQHIETTWNKLYSKHSTSSGSNFLYMNESFRLHSDPLPIRPMVNDLVQYFIENGIDYIISPYDASFQLSYLYQNGFIDSIYALTDVLLTKVDKFILGMEFQSKDFRFVYKLKVLNDMNLTERRFLDLSIMVGCSVQPETFSNFPPLPKANPMAPYSQLNYFRLALDLFYQYNAFCGGNAQDLYGYISGLGDRNLVELYLKGHAVVKYMPVMNSAGFVELYCNEMAKIGLAHLLDFKETTELPKENEESLISDKREQDKKQQLRIPTEIHSIISQRLPPEIYFYQSLGLLPLKLLGAITLGKYHVRPPLESGLGDAYKKLITSDFRENSLDYQFNLVTQLLARYYQGKKIEVVYWFKDGKRELNSRIIPPIYSRLGHLNLTLDEAQPFTMSSFFKALPGAFTDKNNLLGANESSIIATGLLRGFSLVSIVSNEEILPIGVILRKFVESHPMADDTTIQSLTLLLLLLKFDPASLFANDRNHPGVPRSFKDAGADLELTMEEADQVTLLSRVFSLQKFRINPINYQGPISRSLTYFRSQIKVIHDLILGSVQVAMVDLLSRNEKLKLQFQTREQWYNIIRQIPFFRDLNNTLLGVVCEIYYDRCIKLAKKGLSPEESAKSAKSNLMDTIFQVQNPSFNINLNSVNSVSQEQFVQDFGKGIEFWSHFKDLAKIASEEDPKLLSKTNLSVVMKTNELVKSYNPN